MRLLFLMLLLVGVTANAATVTFEDVTPTSHCGFAPVPCRDSITTSEGFVFSHTGNGDPNGYQEVRVVANGPDGNYLTTDFHPEYGTSMRITHDSGQAFDLHSLDTVIPSSPPAYDFDYVHVSGYDLGNNLIVSKQFSSLPSGWVTIEFDESWDSVHGVVISGYGFCTFGCASIPNRIDNFTASVVPIPAAVWLFGSALAGLGWLRRKQTV
jgi:hypothetical protein